MAGNMEMSKEKAQALAMPSGILDYILAYGPIVISFIALGVSIYALRSSWRQKALDRGLEYKKLRAETGVLFNNVKNMPNDVRTAWHSVMAARGNFHSGARLKLDDFLDRKISDLERLEKEISKTDGANKLRSIELLDVAISDLVRVREDLLAIKSDLSERLSKAAAIGAEMRAEAENRSPASQ